MTRSKIKTLVDNTSRDTLTDLLAEAYNALNWQEMAEADPAAARQKGYFETAAERRQEALKRIREVSP